MNYEYILVDRREGNDGSLATLLVTLNRPDRRNAIDLRLRAELAEILEAAAADDAVRSIVITGAGKGFCSGGGGSTVKGGTPEGAGEGEPQAVTGGRWGMNPARHDVQWNGQPVSLTVTEFLILEALAQRPGVIKSRNQLMDAAYCEDVFVDDRTIDSHIKRLRRKFREADPDFAAIETLYGAGSSYDED